MKNKTIIIAGGCFWGVEAYFKLIDGVLDTVVGYADGPTDNPTYEKVCSGLGHAEAVKITYDSSIIDLDKLLDHYFNIVDPTYFNRQGPDVGVQYRSGIYNFLDSDLPVIEAKLTDIKNTVKKPIFVDVKPSVNFIQAEDYHQNYLEKNKNGYCHINLASVKNVK